MKSLRGAKSQLQAHTLGAIYDAILRFRAFADRLYEVAKDAAMRRQLAQLRVEAVKHTYAAPPAITAQGARAGASVLLLA